MDLVRLAQHVGVQWPPTGRGRKRDEDEARILELWLACRTQREIAEQVGVDAATVNRTIAALQNGKLSVLQQPCDSLQLDTLWQFSHNADYGMDYPGRIPGQILENLLYLYTQRFDTVVDPMAGGGTTIDVCKAMYRRYRAYDLNPVRADIGKLDLPERASASRLSHPDALHAHSPETRECNISVLLFH